MTQLAHHTLAGLEQQRARPHQELGSTAKIRDRELYLTQSAGMLALIPIVLVASRSARIRELLNPTIIQREANPTASSIVPLQSG